MKLITEEVSNVKIITEGKGSNKKLYIEGVFLQGNIKNRNGRMYPVETLAREVDRYNESFVGRLRKRFSQVFNDMLKTQLILKNIITPEDWNDLEDHIQYDFLYDNHFSDLKKNELLNEQLGVVASMEPYMGKYFSNHYVRTKVLKQTEDDIKEIDKEIEKEIKDGSLMDPNAMVDPNTGAPMDPNMDLGQPITEPDLESQGSATEAPEGGEI